MAAKSRFAEVSDECLNSLLDKSTPKSTENSTNYRMTIFIGRNVQTKFDLLAIVAVNLTFATSISVVFLTNFGLMGY